jgi:prepilin-type processing-associated H-X9-DG protein
MALVPRRGARAFTLVEVLVVISIVIAVIALVAVASGRVRAASMRVSCLAAIRSIGTFVTNHTLANEGRYPRSQHSAAAHGEAPWIVAMYRDEHGLPLPPTNDPRWGAFVAARLRCPFDGRDADPTRSRFSSYGLNVYCELAPQETGGPTYRTLSTIRHPARTVQAGELDEGSLADHLMAHFWAQYGTPPEIAPDRHGSTQSVLFIDGHVADLPFAQTFIPNLSIDLWNPATAR